MTGKRIQHIILFVFKKMQEPFYQGVAAELAFFFLMSLVPASILLGQILGVFSVSMEVLLSLLKDYVAPEITETISTLFDYQSSTTMSIVLLVLVIWAASKAQFSLARIANYTFTGEATGLGYIKERLRAMKSIVFTLFTLVFSLIILVYGEVIVSMITAYAEKVLGLDYQFSQIWYLIRWPIALGLFFLMISYNYYALPTEKVKFKKILPGSIMASAGMLLATKIYSFYVNVFANYDIIYGGLASVVALLIWFYILAFILVIGIQFNVAWDETR